MVMLARLRFGAELSERAAFHYKRFAAGGSPSNGRLILSDVEKGQHPNCAHSEALRRRRITAADT